MLNVEVAVTAEQNGHGNGGNPLLVKVKEGVSSGKIPKPVRVTWITITMLGGVKRRVWCIRGMEEEVKLAARLFVVSDDCNPCGPELSMLDRAGIEVDYVPVVEK